MQQRVHHGSPVNAGSGVNHHAGGLVDGYHACVLIKHREIDVFRLGLQGRRRTGFPVDDFRAADQIRRFRRRPVHLYFGVAYPALQTRPAEFGQTLVEELIESLAFVGLGGANHHQAVALRRRGSIFLRSGN